ncbi:unnamed protein product [Alopecurus aequalis]
MASQLPPSPPPTRTTITGLTDDLLSEIFLRLQPSQALSALPSAAATSATPSARLPPSVAASVRTTRRPFSCSSSSPRWRLSRSFPTPGAAQTPCRPFSRSSWSPRCAPISLESSSHSMEIPFSDPSCNGYLILDNMSGGTWRRAAYNPLTQALDQCIYEPDYILPFDFYTLPDEYGQRPSFEFYTLSCEDGQGMSRVVCVHHQDHVTPCTFADSTAVVFSCDTMEWQISWKTTLRLPISYKIRTAMVVGGLICWRGWMYEQIVVLDTTACQFSLIDLPMPLKTQDKATYKLGLFAPDCKEFTGCSMEEEGCDVSVGLVAVIDGFVYLSIFYCKDTKEFEVYLSLCLETSEIREIFKSAHRYNEGAEPYVMAWPPSLVHCKEESETEFTGDSVADDGPVCAREASYLFVAALRSLSQALMNDGPGNEEMVAKLDAFLGPTADDEGSLIRNMTTLDAYLRNARDCILRIRA